MQFTCEGGLLRGARTQGDTQLCCTMHYTIPPNIHHGPQLSLQDC